MTTGEVINIAGYRFASLDDLPRRRRELKTLCNELGVKGTILLSGEGINVFLAGTRTSIDRLLEHLRSDPSLADLRVKESRSDRQPFSRLLVRLKKEIIALGVDSIRPGIQTSPRISPRELKQWLDEARPVVLLDVRNDYEIELGTFHGAVTAGIDSFREFPDSLPRLATTLRQAPVVTFCTGGIRCEKAAPLLEQAGIRNVFQLDGGILQYFEDCGDAHFQGNCFVFDHRVAVDPRLHETPDELCFVCQHVVTAAEQASGHYIPGKVCPHCYQAPDEIMRDVVLRRREEILAATNPLPGSVPYDNVRPLNIPRRFDGMTLVECLTAWHPHLGTGRWRLLINAGRLRCDDHTLAESDIVREGQRIVHCIPATVEPEVSAEIEVLHEDDCIIVINKPAPLPMHPAGRYNRNTLTWILGSAFGVPLRAAHRLDANTSGLVVFSKSRKIAACIQSLFEQNRVEKRYVARVHGHPVADEFDCSLSISSRPGFAGARGVDEHGPPSLTRFSVRRRCDDGTSLIHAFPVTGRTNQIRVHLWHSGLPVVGDPLYQRGATLGEGQTLGINDPPMQLHAAFIGFTHPGSGERVEFTAPVPLWD